MTTNWVAESNRTVFSVSGGQTFGTRCQQGWFLPGVRRESLFHPPLLASWLPAILGHMLTFCLHPHITFTLVSMCSHDLLRRTPVTDLRPTLVQFDLILTNYISKDSAFQLRSHSEIPDTHKFGGDAIQPPITLPQGNHEPDFSHQRLVSPGFG